MSLTATLEDTSLMLGRSVRHQLVTPVIETVRGLLTGTTVGDQWWIAIAWCVGIFAVSFVLAGVLFRRRTSR